MSNSQKAPITRGELYSELQRITKSMQFYKAKAEKAERQLSRCREEARQLSDSNKALESHLDTISEENILLTKENTELSMRLHEAETKLKRVSRETIMTKVKGIDPKPILRPVS